MFELGHCLPTAADREGEIPDDAHKASAVPLDAAALQEKDPWVLVWHFWGSDTVRARLH